MFVLVYIAAVYLVNLTETRQTIIGFGGAFTDAAGINIAALPADAQDHLINSYYSKDGKSVQTLVTKLYAKVCLVLIEMT